VVAYISEFVLAYKDGRSIYNNLPHRPVAYFDIYKLSSESNTDGIDGT
jgi:hypothetical protein